MGGEMMREGKAGADRGGKLGAVAARAEQMDRRQRDVRRHRPHVAERVALRKSARLDQHQLLEALEEIVVVPHILPPPQRDRRDRIGAGRAAEPEIDASGKQRLQHLEAFGDRERRMVGQHHAARPDPDAAGQRRDLADHDVGRGACDRRQGVMLGDPVARVAEAGGELREIEAVAQRGGARMAGGDGGQVEDGERKHARS